MRFAALSLLALVACSGEQPQAARAAVHDERHELGALGYVSYAEEVADPSEAGVTLRDAGRSQPGYDLVTSIPRRIVELLDPAGAVVRRWKVGRGTRISRAELVAGGDLVVVGAELASEAPPEARGRGGLPGGQVGFVARLGPNGRELWRRHLDAHHDVEPLADGRIAVLTSMRRRVEHDGEERWIRDDAVAVLSASGELLEERSVYDLLRAHDGFAFAPVPEKFAEDAEDLLHTNSLDWPAPDRLLLSVRNQCALALVDWTRGEVVRTWGRGELELQHEATLVRGDRVLLFDNGGLERDFSRLVEVDLARGEITWQWSATPPESFFSEARGTVQPLANGNALVANSNSGEAFEVTRDGDVVWRYLSPHLNAQGRRATIRIARYEASFVEALLAVADR